jgi:hypothetical protein
MSAESAAGEFQQLKSGQKSRLLPAVQKAPQATFCN